MKALLSFLRIHGTAEGEDDSFGMGQFSFASSVPHTSPLAGQ